MDKYFLIFLIPGKTNERNISKTLTALSLSLKQLWSCPHLPPSPKCERRSRCRQEKAPLEEEFLPSHTASRCPASAAVPCMTSTKAPRGAGSQGQLSLQASPFWSPVHNYVPKDFPSPGTVLSILVIPSKPLCSDNRNTTP